MFRPLRPMLAILPVFLLLLLLPPSVLPGPGASDSAPPDLEVKTVQGVAADPVPFDLPEVEIPQVVDLSQLPSTPMRIHLHEDSGVSRSAREMIAFDLRTRTETRTPASQDGGEGIRRTQGGMGAGVTGFGPAAKDFSGFTRINDPTQGIYPRHVKIFMSWMNQNGVTQGGSCSGTLIDPTHVLTAGHCVYSKEDKNGVPRDDWAFNVQVFPGYNSGASEMGFANGVALYSWTGWTQDFDYDHDIGMIELDRPIGAIAGWRGVAAAGGWSSIASKGFSRYVYPGADFYDNPVYDGEVMYTQAGTFDHDDDPQIGYNRNTFKGNSGGGAINDNAVWAVVSHGQVPAVGEQTAWDTRITHDKLDDILRWIDDDTPSSPDLVAMDVEVDPIGQVAGNHMQDVSFLALNHSSATFNGLVTYVVYLSENSTISSSDHYVTSGSASVSLSPMQSVVIDASVGAVVPPGLAEGDYTLGVIITNSDANTSNNDTQGQDTEPYAVLCVTQGIPVLANPDDMHPCVPTTVTLAWGSVPGIGVDYELYVGKTLGDGIIYTTSITQHLVSNLEEATLYYWRVRAKTPCGSYSDWSPPRTFFTEGFDTQVSILEPAPDAACLGTTVDFSWDPVPNSTHYRIRLVNEDAGTAVIIDSPTPSAQATGLIPGNHYTWTIKSRDGCYIWGSYGESSAFYVQALVALVPTPSAPADGACMPADVLLQAEWNPLTLDHEFEVQTAAGQPAYSWQGPGDQLWILSMNEDDYRWRCRAQSCTAAGAAWGDWSAWSDFTVDLTPPDFSTPPTSPSHTVGVWSGFELLNVDFQPASDGCGAVQYWLAFDQDPATIPDGSIVATSAGGWERVVPEGENWFHVLAIDAAGNMSPTHHLGPFPIDLAPPGDPVVTADAPFYEWWSASSITASWEPVVDTGSGVAGYSLAWSTSANYVLDDSVDSTLPQATNPGVPEGYSYFYVRSVDVMGNASPQQRAGFWIDRTPPEAELQYPVGGETFFTGDIQLISQNGSDNYAGQSDLVYCHFYSVDGGNSWYEASTWLSGPGQPRARNCVGGPGGNPWDPFQWKVPWVPPASPVIYKLEVSDLAGNIGSQESLPFNIVTGTDVGDQPQIRSFGLAAAVPNPFNPRTVIQYDLPKDALVEISIYDLQGRLIRNLVSQNQSGPARYDVTWDGIDLNGQTVASGVYLYRMRAGDFVESRRMTLLK